MGVQKDMVGSKGSKLNTRIERSLSSVCSTDRLRAYKFSPPTQVKTCTGILSQYKLVLTGILREGFRGGREAAVEELVTQFCEKGTKACKDREIPTLVQKREREKTTKGESGEKVTYKKRVGCGRRPGGIREDRVVTECFIVFFLR